MKVPYGSSNDAAVVKQLYEYDYVGQAQAAVLLVLGTSEHQIKFDHTAVLFFIRDRLQYFNFLEG
eukprot:SAG31_NODE_1203_length_9413_cov_4.778076_7_plen_65_part_00